MPTSTDLSAISHIAKALVFSDFQLTPFSPVIIHHPYTLSSFTAVREKTGVRMIDLLNDKEGLDQWQRQVCTSIAQAKDVWDIYMLITKPFALSFIQQIEKHLSAADLGRLLSDCWMKIEGVSSNPVYSQAQLTALFRKCAPSSLMTPEEQATLAKLPDEITLYRGVRAGSSNVKAMSWTTDPKVAEWFSNRFSSDKGAGDVYCARIRKKDVLAYFLGRSEQELVVNPKGLYQIEKYKRPKAHVQPSRKPDLDAVMKKAADRANTQPDGKCIPPPEHTL